MEKVNLKSFNREFFGNLEWNKFQEQWKLYEKSTGKTAEQAYVFFGGKVPKK